MHQQHLLDDAQMSTFLADGYIVLHPTEIAQQTHADLFAQAAQLYDETRRVGGATTHLQYLGDNVLARIPHLHEVLSAPTVTGALTSILGPGYVLHPHHFVHSAGRADQGFHQDGNLPWNTRGYFRSHRPISAILFYYPQTVTDAMGPTEVLPGTQYWSGNFEGAAEWQHDDHLDRDFNAEASRADDLAYRDARLEASLRVLPFERVERRRLTVPAGSVVIAHYDLVHRGTRQDGNNAERRFMYKFFFLRTQEPRRPNWRNSVAEPDLTRALPTTEPVIAHVWSWLRGEQTGRTPTAEIPRLVENLRSNDESQRRAAGYALGYAGAAAVDALVRALDDPATPVRRMAAFALGETRSASVAAIAGLTAALDDDDELVRSNSAFSLGSLARVAELPAAAIDALLTRLDAHHEPDNTNSANMSRSTVRECVAHALLEAASNGRLDDRQMQQLAIAGLSDPDRYVRGLTVQALRFHEHRDTEAKTLKLAVAFSDLAAANRHAATAEGVLFSSTSQATQHLPFAALFVGATDDLEASLSAGDVGVYLVCERTFKNRPLSLLDEDALPAVAGLFAMVANSALNPREADIHWRDRHAPLALEIHTTMTHYYQLAVLHRFSGPDWNGIAICCCASEEDLRHRFYHSKEGERRIAEDVGYFADTRRSPRRVIADARRF